VYLPEKSQLLLQRPGLLPGTLELDRIGKEVPAVTKHSGGESLQAVRSRAGALEREAGGSGSMSNQLLKLIFTQAWQIAVLAIVVAVVTRTVAKNRPHLAHAMWILVLIK